jgi:hypothetical protein
MTRRAVLSLLCGAGARSAPTPPVALKPVAVVVDGDLMTTAWANAVAEAINALVQRSGGAH